MCIEAGKSPTALESLRQEHLNDISLSGQKAVKLRPAGDRQLLSLPKYFDATLFETDGGSIADVGSR